jgi:hypothetical protein
VETPFLEQPARLPQDLGAAMNGFAARTARLAGTWGNDRLFLHLFGLQTILRRRGHSSRIYTDRFTLHKKQQCPTTGTFIN